jgi:hypothetical protein
MAKLEKRMMKKKFASLTRSKYWKYWFGRSIEFIFASENLGYKKRKRFRSVMVVMVLTFVMELLLCPCQRNPLECRF